MNRHRNRKRGFSLVELLISMAIALVIGSAVIMFMVSQAQLTATQNRNMINAEEVRSILTYITDEIAMMGNNVVEPYIEIADVQEMQFLSDIDNNGNPERIRYYLNGPNLKRSLWTSPDGGSTWTQVSDDVLIPVVLTGNSESDSGLWFTYFGLDKSTPATLNDITAVEIIIRLDTDYESSALTSGRLGPQNMVQMATIRNRMIRINT